MGYKYSDSVFVVLGKDRYSRPKIVRTAMRAPSLKPGEIAVKVKLSIDDKLFEQYTPVVEAEITAPSIIEPTVEVLDAEG